MSSGDEDLLMYKEIWYIQSSIPLYRYRRHNTNMTNNKKLLKKWKKLLKKHSLKKWEFLNKRNILVEIPYFIAEIGVNHGCSLFGKKTNSFSKKNGAHVKFQFKAETITSTALILEQKIWKNIKPIRFV